MSVIYNIQKITQIIKYLMRLCLQKLGHNYVYMIIVKEHKTELIFKAVHNLNSDLFVNTIGRKSGQYVSKWRCELC